jgi:hypothetical protein
MEYDNQELNALAVQVHALRATPLTDFGSEKRAKAGMDDVGRLAHRLRCQVAGQNGFMMSKQHVWKPAFAGLQSAGSGGQPTDLASYTTWLSKAAWSEFADELVLAATAQYLSICIRTVPFTPATAAAKWTITEHPCKEMRQAQGYAETRVITLGNNDIHYVLLHGSSRFRF